MSESLLANVLIAPIVSEKNTRSGERENSVGFWVNPNATKRDIKKAVEIFFKVKVDSVRTLVKRRDFVTFGQISGRVKRKKKAYVKLSKGQQINFAELD